MRIIYKEARLGLQEIEDNTIASCMTSPPYYQQRNYMNNPLQIGLEETHHEYIDELISVFELLKKKLKNDGSLFVNIGDKYDKNKSLMMIPSKFAIKMIENGWILRNEIIWHKPNFQPSPVKDRLCNAHEVIYHFVLNKQYYYDLDSIRVENKCEKVKDINAYNRFKDKITNSTLSQEQKKSALLELDKLYAENKINKDARLKLKDKTKALFGSDVKLSGRAKELETKGYCFHCNNPLGKNMGDVLSINLKANHNFHEAVFPDELIIPLVKCSTKENDIVLDCFCGTGTTLKVAEKLGRKGLGIDINNYESN